MTAPPGALREESQRIAGLAWPVVLGQIGLVAMGTVDMLMVGHLGAAPLAAIGIANTWSFAALILGMGACAGLDPFFSQAYGANEPKAAGDALIRGALILGALAILLMAFHFAARPGLTLLQQPEILLDEASRYCEIVGLAVVPFLGFSLLKQLLQGSGQMRPAMWVIAGGNLINVVANWVFIYGHLGMEPLGVAGAAWSTTVVRWAMFAALFAIARRELAAVWPDTIDLRDLGRFAEIASTALPVSLQIGLEVWAFNASTLMAGWLGPHPLAAHIAALNIASLAFMVPLGIGAAAATRVGNLVGANHRWAPAAWTSLLLAGLAATTTAALLTTLAEPLAALYNPDGAVIPLIVTVIPIAVVFQWVDAGQVVSFGILRGLADTRKPMVANLIGYWILGLPIGYVLAFHQGFGLSGIWWGMTVGLSIVCVLLVGRIRWHVLRAAALFDASGYNSHA